MEYYQNLTISSLVGEEWRDVVGYEGLYQISSYGRVRSYPREVIMPKGYFKKDWKRTYKSRILKQVEDGGGYLMVTLYDATKTRQGKNFKVHRLVCSSFILNMDNKPHIDHMDCNRKNNHVSNLRWCTCSENQNNRNTLKKREMPVIQLSLDGKFVQEYRSAKYAEKIFDFSAQCIRECCKKRQLTHKGYLWVYKHDYKSNTN